MLSSILSAVAPTVGKFIVKNSGKLIGSGINKMKNSNRQWLKNVGDKAEKAINNATNYVGEGVLKKQINNAVDAAQGKEVKFDLNLNDTSHNQLTQLAQPNALLLPQQFYKPNIGGTNFKRYRNHRHRRIEIKPQSHHHKNKSVKKERKNRF